MSEGPKMMDDLARLAQGAIGAANSARAEAQANMRAWLERQVADMDFVPREDFETVADMARLAREENDELKARLEALENQVSTLRSKTGAGKGASKSAAKSA